jgi:uncharacterized protein (DUF488 family)
MNEPESSANLNRNNLVLWTVGHSTRPAAEFLSLLKSTGVELLVDVRTFPGSRRYPQFNKERLKQSLNDAAIEYLHTPELGGRRRAKPDSMNMAWRNEMFRGYADYMETEEFRAGIDRLQKLARAGRTAIMCAEAVWWRCHRSLIADYLKARGTTVLHIVGDGKLEEHPFTPAARIVNGELSYRGVLDTTVDDS